MEQKGPLWPLYADLYNGRLVQREDGVGGIVCFGPFRDHRSLAQVCSVRWDDADLHDETNGTVTIPLIELQGLVEDEFADEAWVPLQIRELQRANWQHTVVGAICAAASDMRRKRAAASSGKEDDRDSKRKQVQPQDSDAGDKQATPATAKATSAKKQTDRQDGGAGPSKPSSTRSARARGRPRKSDASEGKQAAQQQHEEEEEEEQEDEEEEEEEEEIEAGPEHATEDGDFVVGWTKKRYPKALCKRPGDKAANELDVDELDGEYEVECIMDEVKHRGTTWYLVKWKGFELRLGTGKKGLDSDEPDLKGDWEPAPHLGSQNLAVKEWNKCKPAWWTDTNPKQAKQTKKKKK